jgi:effector-binding domain-containing protein
MATEEAKYHTLENDGKFALRDYSAHVVAETIVQGGLEQAGNEAFKKLFRYISGDNRSRAKLAMTAPVGQQPAQGHWAVSFTMPASQSMETLPDPEDLKVVLRQIPARRMAAVRYSGFWDEKGYFRHKQELEAWIQAKGLVVAGDPIWARYNSPFTLWFLRRNEILIPVEG